MSKPKPWAERYRVARETVLRSLPKNAVGAEIGVWRGEFSAALIEHTQPKTLHLIDPWVVAEDPKHRTALYGADRGIDMENVFATVRDRFSEPITSGQVVLHRAPSAEAMAAMADESLDFVYIDGDHAYEAVSTDLDLAWQKCRPGGMIAIDDYSGGKWWGDDVIRATNEFIGSKGAALSVIFAMTSQVVLLKRA